MKRNSVKVIKAPKFSTKAYEKSLKVNNKPGRNESNVDSNFGFVFQPIQANQENKQKVRLSSKRNSLAPAMLSFPISREGAHKNEDSKRADKKKEKPSISKGKLKISISNKDSKEVSRFAHMRKASIDMHQRSNNEPKSDFERLLDEKVKENWAATERHTSSLIENFDQSEFIKNVIIQSRKIGGNRFGSPGQTNSTSMHQPQISHRKCDKNFMKDMKKHGILKAFNDINKFTEFFQNSPSGNQDTFEGNSFYHKHCNSQNIDCDYQSSSMQNIAEAAHDKNTKSTYILEEMEKEEESQNIKSIKWIFPFQRRARSHSPPKNAVITNKIIETMNNNSPDGVLATSSIHKEETDDQKPKKSKAVVANANFLIGSYHLLNKRNKLQSYMNEHQQNEGYVDEPLLQGKEVEEWLMGSGLSIPDATTGCTDNSELNKQFSANLSGFLNTLKNRQIEKEQESPQKKWMEDWGDLEEWMFDSLHNEDDVDDKNNEDIIPDERSLDGNFPSDMPEFPSTKRSPYIHKDQIIEEEEEFENEFVKPDQQFGFQNLSSYIDQMDQWIEEGRTFK